MLVFPSLTDTFGLISIEAPACETPVAACPVAGPLDVPDECSGATAERLEGAIRAALRLDRIDCVARTRQFTWKANADQFLAALVPPPRRNLRLGPSCRAPLEPN